METICEASLNWGILRLDWVTMGCFWFERWHEVMLPSLGTNLHRNGLEVTY
jgi:hypothetical protein